MSAVVRYSSSLVVFVYQKIDVMAPPPVTHKRRVTGIALFFLTLKPCGSSQGAVLLESTRLLAKNETHQPDHSSILS